jgi:hypothetical protein
MPPPEVWGPAVWTLFHTLAEKINVNAYPVVFPSLFNMIVKICRYLPCPECSSDASKFLAKVKVSDLKSKESLKAMLCVFHNTVNAKKRKPIFHYSNIGIYGKYNLIWVINNFISKYQTKGNMKLLTESFQRQFVINNFKVWFQRFYKAFAEVPAVVEEPVTHVEEPVTHVEEHVTHVEEHVTHVEEHVTHVEEHVTHVEEPIDKPQEEESFSVTIEEPAIHIEEEPIDQPQEEVTISNIEEPAIEDSLSDPIEEPVLEESLTAPIEKQEEVAISNIEELAIEDSLSDPIEEQQEEVAISNIEEPAIEDSLSDPIEEPVTLVEEEVTLEEPLDSAYTSVNKKSKKNKNKKNKK